MERIWLHLAAFESYSDFLYIFHDKGIQPIPKHTRYNFKMYIEPSIEFQEYQLLLGPTSMISLISHSFSSLSNFRCAVPTSLSLLKKDLGRQKQQRISLGRAGRNGSWLHSMQASSGVGSSRNRPAIPPLLSSLWD